MASCGALAARVTYAGRTGPSAGFWEEIMELLGRILAGIGATAILFALTFVSLLVGVLIHAMILLMAGKPIDDLMRKRGHKVFEPGSLE